MDISLSFALICVPLNPDAQTRMNRCARLTSASPHLVPGEKASARHPDGRKAAHLRTLCFTERQCVTLRENDHLPPPTGGPGDGCVARKSAFIFSGFLCFSSSLRPPLSLVTRRGGGIAQPFPREN